MGVFAYYLAQDIEGVFMKKVIVVLLSLFLTSCSWFHLYRPDVVQGNVLKPAMVNKIHTGMTSAEVRDVLGTPVLKDTFIDNQLLYVYNFIPNSGKPIEKKLILTFSNRKLIRIQK